MRKLFIFLLAFAMLFGTVPMVCAGGGEQPAAVYVDGKLQIFSDAQPVILDGRTLVPIRSVAEVLGAQVDWQDSTQTVLIDKGDKHIELTIGSKSPTVNGSPVNLDAPAVIMNGRTMVPLRFVSEALGAKVVWDGTVKIYSDPSKAPAEQPKAQEAVYPEGYPQELIQVKDAVEAVVPGVKTKTGDGGDFWGLVFYGGQKGYEEVVVIRDFPGSRCQVVQNDITERTYTILETALTGIIGTSAESLMPQIRETVGFETKKVKCGNKSVEIMAFYGYRIIEIN